MMGYSSGHVDLYNLQSGIFRGTLSRSTTAPVAPTTIASTPATPTTTAVPTPVTISAHEGSVRSLAMLRINQLLVSAGQDRRLVFWSGKRTEIAALTFKTQITKIKQHRNRFYIYYIIGLYLFIYLFIFRKDV